MTRSRLRLAATLLFATGVLYAEAPAAPARFFDAANRMSFTIPVSWDFALDFSTQPLLAYTAAQGGRAEIWYEPRPPLEKAHLQTEWSPEALAEFARQDLAARHPQARVLAAEARTLSGRNAYEITWADDAPPATEAQSVYAFVDDRFIVITLRADRNVFPWQVPDFQTWLGEIQMLSRRDSGALNVPAHGGIWLQSATGARVALPDAWLIGAADDRLIAAALVQDERRSELTITSEQAADGTPPVIDAKTRSDARSGLAIDMKVTAESEEPFHGYPAYRIAYEGYRQTRFVKGADLWIASPKARWLISIEADGALFNRLGDDYRKILEGFEFL